MDCPDPSPQSPVPIPHFPVRCSLLPARCSLPPRPPAFAWLRRAGRPLTTDHWPPVARRCSLLPARCSLFAVRCSLFAVRCSLFAAPLTSDHYFSAAARSRDPRPGGMMAVGGGLLPRDSNFLIARFILRKTQPRSKGLAIKYCIVRPPPRHSSGCRASANGCTPH